ncbi:MAG: bile acid:sodium symporter family protein [Bacteroidota bacterium]
MTTTSESQNARKLLLRGLLFPISIFAVVLLALYYPERFTHIGDFESKRLIVPLLMLIMFGVGTELRWQDFKNVIKMPQAVLVGVICQFSLMPLVGYALVSLAELPPEIAAGVILVGCSPSGLASNVMSYLAKANLALSITLTAVATLLAPFLTPLLMKLFADQLVKISVLEMMRSIFMIVIIPIGLGLLFNAWRKDRFPIFKKILPLISMFGIGFIILVITAVGHEGLKTVGWTLVLIIIAHNTIGYLLGYGICKAFRMGEKNCRTIALEVGMQNSGLAAGIAVSMELAGTMGLAATVFGPWMNISGSLLATFWRLKGKPKESNEAKEALA